MSSLAWAAAAATTAAVVLARPPGAWVLRVRLGGAAWLSPGRRRAVGRATGAMVLVVAVMAATAISRLPYVIAGVAAAGVVAFAVRQVRLTRTRAAAEGTRSRTIAALDLLASELRAGILPRQALADVAEDAPSLGPAAAAALHGGDVAAALRSAGTEPGAAVLNDLAGAWQIAERAGAPLADVLDRVATAVRDDTEVDREVRAEAAPARATGRLMAVLPLLGLSLGAGMGADPVHVLTGTVVGAACLAGGVALACVGVAWVDRIVRSVEMS